MPSVLLQAQWDFPVRAKGHLKADTQAPTFSSTVSSLVPFLPKISGFYALVQTLTQEM